MSLIWFPPPHNRPSRRPIRAEHVGLLILLERTLLFGAHDELFVNWEALAAAHVNIEMLNQGASEISMMFGVRSADRARAVRALYDAYFKIS